MLFNIISFFAGFLTSSIIDTSLGEFGEWAIVGAAIVVANIEAFNNVYYSITSQYRMASVKKTYSRQLLANLNFLKIGVLYGLIVDAFKLGSEAFFIPLIGYKKKKIRSLFSLERLNKNRIFFVVKIAFYITSCQQKSAVIKLHFS